MGMVRTFAFRCMLYAAGWLLENHKSECRCARAGNAETSSVAVGDVSTIKSGTVQV